MIQKIRVKDEEKQRRNLAILSKDDLTELQDLLLSLENLYLQQLKDYPNNMLILEQVNVVNRAYSVLIGREEHRVLMDNGVKIFVKDPSLFYKNVGDRVLKAHSLLQGKTGILSCEPSDKENKPLYSSDVTKSTFELVEDVFEGFSRWLKFYLVDKQALSKCKNSFFVNGQKVENVPEGTAVAKQVAHLAEEVARDSFDGESCTLS